MEMNLSSTVSASSSSAKDLIASEGLEKPDVRERRNSKPDAASSSQVRLQDACLGGLMDRVAGKLAATDESQELWEFLDLNHGAIMRKKLQGKTCCS